MSTQEMAAPPTPKDSELRSKLLKQYGYGPIQFSGTDNAFYERHLVFDNAVGLAAAGPRERFEAIARSVRDILSQRWIHTEDTYERQNPKRVYYLSMEFLIGRSHANNVTNLLLDPLAKQTVKEKHLDWLGLLEQEPDAGLGNGGLGRLAACFLDSMATMQLPAMGYGLRYEYGIFHQAIQDGWQHEQPDNWLRCQDPWEVLRPYETVEVKLNASLNTRDAIELEDPVLRRCTCVTKENSRTTVVWNPWVNKAHSLSDLADDEWMQMICIETSNVSDFAVDLAPGQQHKMKAFVRVADRCGGTPGRREEKPHPLF